MAGARLELDDVRSLRSGRRVALAAAGAGAVAWIAFYASWIATAPGGDGALVVFADSAYLVPIAVAAAFCALAALRSSGARRTFWILSAAGTASWLAGELIWAIRDLRSGDVPFPWWPDLFYELFYVAFAVALVRVFRPQLRAVTAADVIDAALCVGTFAVLWWRLVIAPIGVEPSWTSAATLLGPVTALGILGLVVTLRILPSRRGTLGITIAAFGLAVGTLTDAADVRLTFTSAYENGSWVELGWQIEACLYALAAAATVLGVGERVDWSRFRVPPSSSSAFAAAAMAVGAGSLAFWSGQDIAPRVAEAMLLGLGVGRVAGLVSGRRGRLDGTWDEAGVRVADQLAWHLWQARSSARLAGLALVETDAWRDGRSGTHASIERRLARLSDRVESVVPTGFGRFALLCTVDVADELGGLCLAAEAAVAGTGRSARVVGVLAGPCDGPQDLLEAARERLGAPAPAAATRTAAPAGRSAATRVSPAGSPR